MLAMFMKQFLDWIDRGGILRNIVGYLLRTIGVLLIVGAVCLFFLHLYQWYRVFAFGWWGPLFDTPSTSESIFSTLQTLVAGPVFIALQCLLYYMVIHTIYLRAGNILELDATNYTVIPIFAQILRLGGDLAVVHGIVWSIQLCVHAVFSAGAALFHSLFGVKLLPYSMFFAAHEGGGTAMRLIDQFLMFGPSMGQQGDWLFVFSLALTAVFTLIVTTLIQMIHYWLAELQIVLVDIARNTETKSTAEE